MEVLKNSLTKWGLSRTLNYYTFKFEGLKWGKQKQKWGCKSFRRKVVPQHPPLLSF